LEKNSFTLFETLLSVVILSIVVAGFYKLATRYNNQDIYSQYINHTNNYTVEYFDYIYDSLPTAKITITANPKYKKYIYKTSDITLQRYSLD